MTRAPAGSLDVPALIDAATRLIARRGFDTFTLELLAEEAEVSIESVRARFADEVALLSEQVVHALTGVEQKLQATVAQARDGTDALARYVDTYVHHFLERPDEFKQTFLLRQIVGPHRYGISAEVRQWIVGAISRPIGLVEAKLLQETGGQDLPGGIHPRRLAFAGHLMSVGLLTSLGSAAAAGTSLLHTHEDLIREAVRALGAPVASLRQHATLNQVAVELGRSRTEAQLMAKVPELLRKVLEVDEAFFALRGPDGELEADLPAEARRALHLANAVHHQDVAGAVTLIAAPVRYEGEAAGVVCGRWRGVRPDINQGHLSRTETFAAMVGMTLENVRLYENLQDQVETRTRRLHDAHVRLAESEKMATLGKLVAAVVHEVNTPVAAALSSQTTLMTAVDRLGQRTGSDPESDKLRRIAAHSGELISTGLRRVSEVVDRLKRFSRLDAAATEQIDLNAALTDTLALLQHELPPGGRIETDLTPLPPITCEAGRINHVLLQVIRNAMEAIGPQGMVRVRSSAPRGDPIDILVEDDGPGIAPEDLPHVFEPGFTKKGARVRAGLGLATAYQIVQDHGGEIRIDSTPGKGTRVTITLPLERPASGNAGEVR